jgi:hypothetical protein
VKSLGLRLRFRFELQGNEIVWTLPGVEENGEFCLQSLYIPDHRLITATAHNGDSYLRHVTRRTNWSRGWCRGQPLTISGKTLDASAMVRPN